mgnify:CR=1 FL=1|jgi:hypothetical protein
MKKLIIFFILIPGFIISQSTLKPQKDRTKIRNGIIMTIGGIGLTTLGMGMRPIYTDKGDKKQWYKQTHKWPPIAVGFTFTITGLITIFGKEKLLVTHE